MAPNSGVVSCQWGRTGLGPPVPLLGGMAIFTPLLAAWVAVLVQSLAGMDGTERPGGLQMAALFAGTTWTVALGTWDDVRPLGWRLKLLGLLGGALLLVFGGYSIEPAMRLPWGQFCPKWLGSLLFVLVVITTANAINFIDGIDGLAGGTCFLAAMTVAVVALMRGDSLSAWMACFLAGSLLGFLLFNFPPASILMGDGGSLALGLLLGTLAVQSAGSLPGLSAGITDAVLIPMLPFVVPLCDLCVSILRRAAQRKAVHTRDFDHVHHRLLRITQSPRLTVGTLCVISAMCCSMTVVFFLIEVPYRGAIYIAVIAVAASAMGKLYAAEFGPIVSRIKMAFRPDEADPPMFVTRPAEEKLPDKSSRSFRIRDKLLDTDT